MSSLPLQAVEDWGRGGICGGSIKGHIMQVWKGRNSSIGVKSTNYSISRPNILQSTLNACLVHSRSSTVVTFVDNRKLQQDNFIEIIFVIFTFKPKD
jgi:Tfp pilus assembly protein FimT